MPGEGSRPPINAVRAQPKILPTGVEEGDIPSQVDKHAMMDRRLAAMLPTTLFVINLETGAITELGHWNDWTNHQQFSPTDPTLLMFAHEGRQWKVNRIWLIRADEPSSAPMLVQQRTMKMEIAVHEYWGDDGRNIYYDLQTPLSEDFWIGCYNVIDGSRTSVSSAARPLVRALQRLAGRDALLRRGRLGPGDPLCPGQGTRSGCFSSAPS